MSRCSSRCSFAGQPACRSGMRCFPGASDPNMHKQDTNNPPITFPPSTRAGAQTPLLRQALMWSLHTSDVCLSMQPIKMRRCGARPVLTILITRANVDTLLTSFTVSPDGSVTLHTCLFPSTCFSLVSDRTRNDRACQVWHLQVLFPHRS
ncbi:hypothetical protein L210DRAFT_2080942 [Boletus edulis BED1]|uniref:Uncharacterized protein n=1 Tax=Boletus edulis BED1 TaxID=1328754 RepID=A0AAD4BVY4_BOLED|nr:hypothetical protein L210DRAFT_2080942 [Boletus edulis BED1]